jgi:hypothetical protein
MGIFLPSDCITPGGRMININRWVGYISISIVMIFGVLMVSGMIGEFEMSTKLLVAGVVFVYVLLRLIFMFHTRRRHADRAEFRRETVEKE